MHEVLNCLVALTALAIVFILPTWLPAARLTPSPHLWRTTLNATILGLASQSIIGLFWDRIAAGGNSRHEAIIYHVFWLLCSVGSLRVGRSTPRPTRSCAARDIQVWLTLIAAIIVRTLFALSSDALGQSDAYSHLQFVRQAVDHGALFHRLYPPAYSWVMALPAITFNIDPYWLARFGGAFFGAAMVLALFRVARAGSGYTAAIYCMALAAFNPLWTPLLKTGVGAFANQLGLFWLPVIYHAYLVTQTRPHLRASIFLAVAALGLAASVPLMFIAMIPVLALDHILSTPLRRGRVWIQSAILVATLLPAFALIGGEAIRFQGPHRGTTVNIVVNRKSEKAPDHSQAVPPSTPTRGAMADSLLRDFLVPKRTGFGVAALDATAIGLAILFAYCLAKGIRRRSHPLTLMGAWGLVTSVQSATGIMQFTAYQREGWSLLGATAWLGGIVIATMRSRYSKPWFRGLVSFAFAGSFVLTCMRPPSHPLANSIAENEIVAVSRAAATRARHAPDARPLTIISRQFSGYCGDQGDIVSAVVGHDKQVTSIAIGPDTAWPRTLQRHMDYLVIIDIHPPAPPGGIFQQSRTEQTRLFTLEQARLFALNELLFSGLAALGTNAWAQVPKRINDNLLAIELKHIPNTTP